MSNKYKSIEDKITTLLNNSDDFELVSDDLLPISNTLSSTTDVPDHLTFGSENDHGTATLKSQNEKHKFRIKFGDRLHEQPKLEIEEEINCQPRLPIEVYFPDTTIQLLKSKGEGIQWKEKDGKIDLIYNKKEYFNNIIGSLHDFHLYQVTPSDKYKTVNTETEMNQILLQLAKLVNADEVQPFYYYEKGGYSEYQKSFFGDCCISVTEALYKEERETIIKRNRKTTILTGDDKFNQNSVFRQDWDKIKDDEYQNMDQTNSTILFYKKHHIQLFSSKKFLDFYTIIKEYNLSDHEQSDLLIKFFKR